MIFNFHKDYVQAQKEMDLEEEERVITIDPISANTPEFKSFAGAFMYSTLGQMKMLGDVLKELKEAKIATDARVTRLENTVLDHEAKITTLTSSVTDLTAELADVKRELREMKQELATGKEKAEAELELVKGKAEAAKRAAIEGERHSRSFNLRAFNIPEEADEKTPQTIALVTATIKRVTGLDIPIEYGHRVGAAPRGGGEGEGEDDAKPRGVIFRFMSRQDKWRVLNKRKAFFDAKIPLYEDLPASDLVEKKKWAGAMKVKFQQKKKVSFMRGKWHVDGVEYNG